MHQDSKKFSPITQIEYMAHCIMQASVLREKRSPAFGSAQYFRDPGLTLPNITNTCGDRETVSLEWRPRSRVPHSTPGLLLC